MHADKGKTGMRSRSDKDDSASNRDFKSDNNIGLGVQLAAAGSRDSEDSDPHAVPQHPLQFHPDVEITSRPTALVLGPGATGRLCRAGSNDEPKVDREKPASPVRGGEDGAVPGVGQTAVAMGAESIDSALEDSTAAPAAAKEPDYCCCSCFG